LPDLSAISGESNAFQVPGAIMPGRLSMARPHTDIDWLAWSGLKNGELLRTAENDAFEVFPTGDRTMSYEQDLTARQIAVVVLSAVEWHPNRTVC
jgi:hypothetical protein